MWILMIFLGIAAAVFAALWVISRYNLKQAVDTLRAIRQKKTGQRLRLAAPDRQLEALIAEANRILDDYQQSEQHHRSAEQQRRSEIANISHDLRTPLTSILGYLQLMQKPACTESERREYLAICENRAHALQELLAGFYDLSRMEAADSTLELAPLEPAGILYQLTADFYTDFLAAGMEPKLEIPEILPEIQADRQALSRIFQNLIQNALRHGGETLLIRSREENGKLSISFRNFAPNLTEEDCRHLFDRFFTADKMRTGKGTGLGLAIVKALCEKMDGTVSAQLSGGNLTVETTFILARPQ